MKRRRHSVEQRVTLDTQMRLAAFEHVRRLAESRGQLFGSDLKAGFTFEGKRIPLVNPQRGIFKPRQMDFLLSIRTVVPRKGGKVWYDDQRKVHRQIYEGDEAVDYAFMGTNPEAPDNLWLRNAWAHKVPIIYFLGVAPRRYLAIIPTYVSGWDANARKTLSATPNRSIRYVQAGDVHLKEMHPLILFALDS